MKLKLLNSLIIVALLFTSYSGVMAEELSSKLSGKILLQVEANGEGWYIYPKENKRYYLGRPEDAFSIMRELGLGISYNDYLKFSLSGAPEKLSGYILLSVEDFGKAYYVNPDDLKLNYLGRPNDAFQVMRNLGLGISDDNLNVIEKSEKSAPVIRKTARNSEGNFKVTKIIDSNKFGIETGETICYIGIGSMDSEDESYSRLIKANEDLILNKSILLKKDTAEIVSDECIYRYVFDGDIFVNHYLILAGYACHDKDIRSVLYQYKFTQAAEDSRKNGFNDMCYTDIAQEQSAVADEVEESEASIFYKVVKIVDGDTIDVDINGSTERIRIIGIDTPEYYESFGSEATARAETLLSGKTVRLEVDSTQGDRDKYDRLLRHVFLETGSNFGEVMIEDGYAREYTYGVAYKYQSEFREAEEYAQSDNLGIWEEEAYDQSSTIQSTSDCSCSSNSKNCSNFSSHSEAQGYYECCLDLVGYDVHSLDGDSDGSACESLP